MPQPELARLHTLELCLLVRFLRGERTKAYNQMRIVQKGSQMVQIDKEVLEAGERLYRNATKRMRVIEGILVDRLGYKPKRIDDKLIASLESKINQEKENHYGSRN